MNEFLITWCKLFGLFAGIIGGICFFSVITVEVMAKIDKWFEYSFLSGVISLVIMLLMLTGVFAAGSILIK